MAWIYLIVAAVFEVGFIACMKLTEGFTKLIPSIFVIVCYMASLGFLTLAVKTLPISVAYPIWTGIGIAGAVLFGVLVFHEPINLIKVLAIAAIVSGIIVLKVVSV
jgi:quaternary ammonium compound-resistance protein SugE